MLINPRFKQHWPHFCLQILLIFTVVFGVILALYGLENHPISLLTAVGLSSLSASAFIIFSSPTAKTADLRRIVFAYAIAMIAGVAFHTLKQHIYLHDTAADWIIYAVLIGLSVACSIFAMGILDVAHPPAVGFAVALAAEPWDNRMLLVTVFALLFIIIVKRALNDWLIDIV